MTPARRPNSAMLVVALLTAAVMSLSTVGVADAAGRHTGSSHPAPIALGLTLTAPGWCDNNSSGFLCWSASGHGSNGFGRGTLASSIIGSASFVFQAAENDGVPPSFDPASGLWTSVHTSTMRLVLANAHGTLTLSGTGTCTATGLSQQDSAVVGPCPAPTHWTATGTGRYAHFTGRGIWADGFTISGTILPA